MDRRSACICCMAVLKASLVSSVAMAAEEAARSVARIAGPRWNVNGDWTPSEEELRDHLLHSHGIDPGSVGLDEMLTLHDNHHNRMGHRAGHGHKKPSKGSAKGYAKF